MRLDTEKIVGVYEHQNGTITIERRGEQSQVTGTYYGKSLSGSYFLKTNHLTGRRFDLSAEDDVDGYNSPEVDALYLRIIRSGAPEQVVCKRQKSTTSTPSSFGYVGNARNTAYSKDFPGDFRIAITPLGAFEGKRYKRYNVRVLHDKNRDLLDHELVHDPTGIFTVSDVPWIDETNGYRVRMTVLKFDPNGSVHNGFISWRGATATANERLWVTFTNLP